MERRAWTENLLPFVQRIWTVASGASWGESAMCENRGSKDAEKEKKTRLRRGLAMACRIKWSFLAPSLCLSVSAMQQLCPPPSSAILRRKRVIPRLSFFPLHSYDLQRLTAASSSSSSSRSVDICYPLPAEVSFLSFPRCSILFFSTHFFFSTARACRVF